MTKKHDYGDGPIEVKYHDLMNGLASGIDEILNGPASKKGRRETGFILLVFPFGETEGRCNYISNGANRKDVIVFLKEQVARFEGQFHDEEGRA